MKKKLKIKLSSGKNRKLICRVSESEYNFITKAIEKLEKESNVELNMSTFIQLSTAALAESIILSKFKIEISIPERTLIFKLKK